MTDAPLVDRVRELLPAGHAVREVPMFGGVSVMLDEKMLVSVRRNDALLVRVDPARSAELLTMAGAERAVMGTSRSMGPGWITVSSAGLAADQQLNFWLQVALDHHSSHPGS